MVEFQKTDPLKPNSLETELKKLISMADLLRLISKRPIFIVELMLTSSRSTSPICF